MIVRYLERLLAWVGHLQDVKTVSTMGDRAMGPPCMSCGKPRFDLAPELAREVYNRLSLERHGHTLDDAPGVCQCYRERAA